MVELTYPTNNIVHGSNCLLISNRRIAPFGRHTILAAKDRIHEALATALQSRFPLRMTTDARCLRDAIDMALGTILQENILSVWPASSRGDPIHWDPGHHPNNKRRENKHDPEGRGVHLRSSTPALAIEVCEFVDTKSPYRQTRESPYRARRIVASEHRFPDLPFRRSGTFSPRSRTHHRWAASTSRCIGSCKLHSEKTWRCSQTAA